MRLGVYYTTSTTNTSVTISMQVWIWTLYSVHETERNNTFKADWAASATTTRSGVYIYTTNDSGSGWSTDNQQQIASYSKTYTKSTSTQTARFRASLTGIEAVGSSATAYTPSWSYTVAALTSYTISYNANGGSGAPSSQTKYYGITLTLRTTRPTREGYNFLGWATTSTATSARYQPGGSYTANASATLYAVWEYIEPEIVYYYIKYNSNCGDETIGEYNQVEQGSSTTIIDTIPTRQYHTFLGWSTNKSATSATYSSGESITPTGNMYLYAVWRCDDETIRLHDDGMFEGIEFVEGATNYGPEEGGKINANTIIEQGFDGVQEYGVIWNESNLQVNEIYEY